MNVVPAELLLSAQRALLGAIFPELRLIKVKRAGSTIFFTAVADRPLSEAAMEALSIAATEIIADFPDCSRISEQFFVTEAELPKEDVLQEGWVYQRAEEQVSDFHPLQTLALMLLWFRQSSTKPYVHDDGNTERRVQRGENG